jgi:hypothetical protein
VRDVIPHHSIMTFCALRQKKYSSTLNLILDLQLAHLNQDNVVWL